MRESDVAVALACCRSSWFGRTALWQVSGWPKDHSDSRNLLRLGVGLGKRIYLGRSDEVRQVCLAR
jgi:hypothetical protein